MSQSDPGMDRPGHTALLIEHQEGAIVSRTLLKRPSGSITLFAFGAGEGLSEHSTPHDAMIFGLGGEAEITIGGENCQLKEGEALHLPAAVPHAVQALNPFKMMLVMLKNTEV